MTDQTGSKSAEKRSYDAFGARRNPIWGAAPVAFSSLTTRGFTGHEDDEELGLVNMKGRLYDPKVGRFLTTDPIVSDPAFGQSWNPYTYGLNNPLKYVDPSGFETTETTYSNGTRAIVFDPVHLLVRPPIGPPLPPPPNVAASQAGLSIVPTDLNATGNQGASTPIAPMAPYDLTFGKSGGQIAGEIARGARQGLVDIGYRAVGFDWGSIPGQLESLGQDLLTGDVEGALDRRFVAPLKQGVDSTVDALIAGDFEAAGRLGVTVVNDAVGTGVLVGGAIGVGAQAVVDATRVPAGTSPTGGAKRGPKTDPNAPHNAKVRSEGDKLHAEGNDILSGGGREEETAVKTPGGEKQSRRPDIIYRTPNREIRGRNVGRTTAGGLLCRARFVRFKI